ncbi:hypothetical protein [Streptomyces sp. A30]|uniref:hypothetical protein n=1 Tax=Streptomyces sp. A30 TaxID=2789273 RepID=UPI00397F842D
MEIAHPPSDAQRLDRAMFLAEARAITQPRLDVPPLSDTERHTEAISRILRSLLNETRGDGREAVRVMRRLGTRLLDESPQTEVTPYAAWQRLVNLARCTEAFLDVESRSR